MKRVLLSLLSLCIVSSALAQNGKIKITKDKIEWDYPNQIVCSENGDTVYIAFGDKSEIVLAAEVANELDRNSLILTADQKIFVQDFAEQPYPYNEAKYLIPTDNQQFKPKVIIKKDELPIRLFHNKKDTISIVVFDSTNVAHCELIRKRATAYQKLPDCKDTTLSIKDLRSFSVETISLQPSSAWTLSAEYFIDGKECTVQNGKISMTDAIWESVKDNKHIQITYKIKCDHPYFSHKRDGVYYDIYRNNESSWWLYVWCAIAGILIVAIVVIVLIYIRKPEDELEKKLALIRQLLSNVDDKFRESVLSIIGEPSQNDTIERLNGTIEGLNKKIEELNKEITELNVKITDLSKQIADKDEVISTLQSEINELSLKLAKAIKDNKSLSDESTKSKDKVKELLLKIDSLKSIIADKDKQIELYLQKIRTLQEKIKTLQDLLDSISRQNMYLFQIDDVLKEISDDILVAVQNVEDEDLKKKLVLPLLKGVNGLDEGLTTYYKRWQDQVMKTQKNFFGKDLYEMTDDEVKTKLVSGFLKNLARGDTFSKLTKLYMYIQADWINEILIKNKFDVDKIEQIFNRLKMLFNDFGIEIIYPRLFVDRMNEHLYTFDPSCEVFKLFPISEEMRMTYSKQADLIVDIIQIGVKIPSENYNRKAIVSIPNF